MCRMTNAVSWDSFQNLCLAIKTMFSIWQVVCVFFAVYKKYTCYSQQNRYKQVVCVFFAVYKKYTCSLSNERWYKLWLKIEVTCFSNTRFTCKVIFDISKQAKFVSLRRQPGDVLAPVSHRSSRRRRQWKRLLLKVPSVYLRNTPSLLGPLIVLCPFNICGPAEVWTRDLPHGSPVLYQLS